jgi:hypothetical protein
VTVANRDVVCKGGHTLTVRSVRGHDEWHCVVCYYIPSTQALLAAYVEKHGGRIVP